jgi:hypothetical protein
MANFFSAGLLFDSNGGIVFSLTLPGPQLKVTPLASNIILAWPANATGFTLESATNLVAPVWSADATLPVIIGGQNVVTNPIVGPQMFFRLQANEGRALKE